MKKTTTRCIIVWSIFCCGNSIVGTTGSEIKRKENDLDWLNKQPKIIQVKIKNFLHNGDYAPLERFVKKRMHAKPIEDFIEIDDYVKIVLEVLAQHNGPLKLKIFEHLENFCQKKNIPINQLAFDKNQIELLKLLSITEHSSSNAEIFTRLFSLDSRVSGDLLRRYQTMEMKLRDNSDFKKYAATIQKYS